MASSTSAARTSSHSSRDEATAHKEPILFYGNACPHAERRFIEAIENRGEFCSHILLTSRSAYRLRYSLAENLADEQNLDDLDQSSKNHDFCS
ncbi:unnamed protein product [Strongylus vulgaris]|uniref:Uncharacterized protein n=1 Tax=Strongylus vulgaris TaxID=40348 RepID=A0A3P7IK47_STRVU|nr:unnamed protein product [Strongylus vulgaris]